MLPPEDRAVAVRALAAYLEDPYTILTLKRLTNDVPAVKAAAAEVLAKVGAPRAQ